MGQLNSGAATETGTASSASGSVTRSTVGSSSANVTTATWTNTGSVTTVVQVEHWLMGKPTNSGAGAGRVWFDCAYSVSGGGGAAGVAGADMTAVGVEAQAHFLQQVAVPAGATVTLTLNANAQLTSGTSFTANWRDALTRWTAIKR